MMEVEKECVLIVEEAGVEKHRRKEKERGKKVGRI